jgi:hypothetical protein
MVFGHISLAPLFYPTLGRMDNVAKIADLGDIAEKNLATKWSM